MSKPSWDDAPEWANYLAQDVSRDWWWFEVEPKYMYGHWSQLDGAKKMAQRDGSFRDTLEPRP